jgi:hypothetical protein
MNRIRIFALAMLVVLAAGACSDGGSTSPPVPGPLLLTLATPSTDDGAVMLTVTGPGITSAQATSSSQQLFWRLVSANELRVILIGPIASGPLLTVNVADAGRPANYGVSIKEVAARDDAVRASVAGYSATLHRSGAQ